MFLLINTTQPKAQVVLAKDSSIIIENYIWQANYRHSEELLPNIQKILDKHNLNLKDIKNIIVISGPGSYTGLRVGIAVANGLSFALKIPIVGINKFETLKDKVDWLKMEDIDQTIFLKNEIVSQIIKEAKKKIEKGKTEKVVKPFYLHPPHITKPKPLF